MSAIEAVILLVFGVPIVLLCGLFVVLAVRMQAQENKRIAQEKGHA